MTFICGLIRRFKMANLFYLLLCSSLGVIKVKRKSGFVIHWLWDGGQVSDLVCLVSIAPVTGSRAVTQIGDVCKIMPTAQQAVYEVTHHCYVTTAYKTLQKCNY
jgi:hypothetical protein